MKMTNLQHCNLNMFIELFGLYPIKALALQYKKAVKEIIKSTKEGGAPSEFHRLDIRTQGKIFALMQYGSLRVLGKANSPDELIYQVDIGDCQVSQLHLESHQKEALLASLAQACGAEILRVNAEKSLFMNLVFIIPNKTPGQTNHEKLVADLDSYGFPYHMTTPAFSYDI